MTKDASLRHEDVYGSYDPAPHLKSLIGESALLAAIFSPEKIAACQKLVEDAQNNFFFTSRADMEAIDSLEKDATLVENYPEFCKRIFQPLSNIKGQADAFGFSLIRRLCHYLLEYCESAAPSNRMSSMDRFITTKLIEALRRAFQERMTDAGGAIETELVAVIDRYGKNSS